MESKISSESEKTKDLFKSAAEAVYKTVFENIQEGILLIDNEGKLIKANSQGLKIHEIDEDEITRVFAAPNNYYNLYTLDHRELPFEKWPVSRVLNKETFRDEKYYVFKKSTKQKIFVRYSGIPQLDENGNLIAAILFVEDISEQVNTKFTLANEVLKRDEYFIQLELYQQKLKDESELLQTVINSIPVMVTIYDKKIQSIIMNQAVELFTGWTNEDAAKTNIMELAYPDPEYRNEVAEYMASLKPGFRDIIMRTKDGRDIETSWANVEIPDGRQVGVGLDISERKKLENELVTAREIAEKENQIQYAFIQNISHEVRTPMNSILGFTELLQKNTKGKKELDFLDAIAQNGKQLLRLINDIIDFSRLDKNELVVNKEETNLRYLLEHADKQMSAMKKRYNKKHLKIVMKGPLTDGENILLETDVLRFQQVLMNLIDNAIKYTEKGEVEVGYELREQDNKILFYVKDSGMGIRKEDHHVVFKCFNRLHIAGGDEFRGTGLGLAICKKLVGLLDGDIWFESEYGKGSVFYFSLPYLKVLTENNSGTDSGQIDKQEKETGTSDIPDLNGSVVLIAEDDTFSYMMMYYMLEETHATIIHADTGSKAIEMFDEQTPDLVFLDIRLPELDGYQVIEHIRKTNTEIPVIAQTANVLPEDTKKIKAAGFNYHATKPISQEGLFRIIRNFF
jgi:PAS domain S-box-containing protein